jgi:hypothetical protein
MKKLKPANGNWVDGDRFWDREADLELFHEKLRDGCHLLLVAQRRMGKTSLMREMKRRLEAEGTRCIFIDLQKASTPEEVVVELSVATRPIQSMWGRTKEAFRNVIDSARDEIDEVQIGDLGVKLRSGLGASNWGDKGDQVFDVLAQSDMPLVLFVDELPIFVNNLLKGPDFVITPDRRESAERFMSWLRSNALRLKGRLAIVIAGSVGLEPVLRQAQLSATLTSFEPFDLQPWSEETASGCIEALAAEKGITLGPDTARTMAERLAYCVPHHVQMFFTAAYDHCRRAGATHFDTLEIEEVYRSRMLSVRGHAELSHYEERLRLVLGKELYTEALDLLTEAAVTGFLTTHAIQALRKERSAESSDTPTDYSYLLWVLEHDGYLTKSGETYIFQVPLLRDWWRVRHEFAFVPILKRGGAS